jgi:hypothetical protein
MSFTAALDIEYARAIPARFTTKRDGTPMACMTCGTPLEMGKAYAATGTAGGWHSYCERCAGSTQAQIAGLVRRIETLVEPLGTNVPADISAMVATAEPVINNVLGRGDPSPSDFLAAKRQLLNIRTAVGQAKAAGQPAPVRTNQYGGKCVTCKVWVEPGTGRIEKQGGRWVTFHLDGQCPTPQAAAPQPVVEQGLYMDNDGTVRKVYMTRNARLAAKKLVILKAGINADGTTKYRGSFQYAAGAIKLIAEGIAAGTTHLMTEAEASAFGMQWSFCCNCGLYLDDDRSVAAGYGPTCADNKGWRYPTYEEAAVILGRPAGPKGKGAMAEDAPQPVVEGVVFCEYCDEAVHLRDVLNEATEVWEKLYVDHMGSETCSGDDADAPDYHHKPVVEAE